MSPVEIDALLAPPQRRFRELVAVRAFLDSVEARLLHAQADRAAAELARDTTRRMVVAGLLVLVANAAVAFAHRLF